MLPQGMEVNRATASTDPKPSLLYNRYMEGRHACRMEVPPCKHMACYHYTQLELGVLLLML